MKIFAVPPWRVVVVGDDHAGMNIHTARARNTSRIGPAGPAAAAAPAG